MFHEMSKLKSVVSEIRRKERWQGWKLIEINNKENIGTKDAVYLGQTIGLENSKVDRKVSPGVEEILVIKTKYSEVHTIYS